MLTAEASEELSILPSIANLPGPSHHGLFVLFLFHPRASALFPRHGAAQCDKHMTP